jgi:hypothetical protein
MLERFLAAAGANLLPSISRGGGPAELVEGQFFFSFKKPLRQPAAGTSPANAGEEMGFVADILRQ